MSWHHRFLSLAEHIAQWSKDPSTKVGAVIVRPDRTIASLGYNGFPRGIADDGRLEDRKIKYSLIVHAELNAIHNCTERPQGFALYTWPFPPCERCAVQVIQSGITHVIAPSAIPDRWLDSVRLAQEIFHEAGVGVTWL